MSITTYIVHGHIGGPSTPVYNSYSPEILPSDISSELAGVDREVDFIESEAIAQWPFSWIRTFAQEEEYMFGRISLIIASFIVALVVLTGHQRINSQAAGFHNGFDLVDKTGIIRKPANYRDLYQFLGTYTVLDPKGNQMHPTYATPGTAEYYRKTGKFPDGAVLVKEVFGTEHAQLTTGDSHWASGTKVWFVKIKDDKHRFPQNALWGDGWGWFLFKADAPDKQVATDYKKDCLGCHIPAKSTDWTYVQGFPVLSSK